jgi:hypothetical protein
MASEESLKAQGLWDFANDRPLARKPERGDLFVLVTRRESFTRLERVQTLSGPGPLVEVPDHKDTETREKLPAGSTLKDALKAYQADPSVVEVREDRD